MQKFPMSEDAAKPYSTQLALDRTWLAHERTLMAWVRTAVSMISFAFTIFKFFQFEAARGTPVTHGLQRSSLMHPADYWAGSARSTSIALPIDRKNPWPCMLSKLT